MTTVSLTIIDDSPELALFADGSHTVREVPEMSTESQHKFKIKSINVHYTNVTVVKPR